MLMLAFYFVLGFSLMYIYKCIIQLVKLVKFEIAFYVYDVNILS